MQIFTHELVAALSKSKRDPIGTQKIKTEDVRNVAKNRDVRNLVRNRFDLTLDLDRRYRVIVYGLLSEGKGVRPFTVREAKDIAANWLPSEFEHLTVVQFRAYLDELEGLGVLKSLRGEEQVQYQLRNANIRRLIGDEEAGQDDIDSKLSEAIEADQSSPLDRHAFFENIKAVLCPITFRDEKGLFGSDTGIDDGSSGIKTKANPNYTVSIVVGSQAQGLSSMEDSMRLLYPGTVEN